MPRRPRLCLGPAPRAPAPGTKARARGLFPSVSGVPRLGARAEGRRPRPRRSLGGAASSSPGAARAGGREGALVSVMCLGFLFPGEAIGRGRRAPGGALQCPLCPPALDRSRGMGLSASAALNRVTWAKLAPLPGRGAAAGHGLSLQGWARCRWDRKALGPGGDRSEDEEGRWICFAKGVGLLAVGGLLYAPVPLACRGGYQGTTVIFLGISTSV